MTQISNGQISLEVDAFSGAFVSFRDLSRNVNYVTEPQLAENFRILLPLPGKRGNYILGRDQIVSSITIHPSGTRMNIRYDSLHSATETFNVAVDIGIEIHDSELRVTAVIDNHTDFTVEEVLILMGGLDDPDHTDEWVLHSASSTGAGREWSAYHEFPGTYLGPANPVWLAMYNRDLAMPWIDLYEKTRRTGVTLALRDASEYGAICAAYSQLFPTGVNRGGSGASNVIGPLFCWPDRDSAAGQPVGLALGFAVFPFIAPGTTWKSPEWVWYVHEGTWWVAADWYRRWFMEVFPNSIQRDRSWLSSRDAWQSTIINYPEDTIGYRFADLPKIAQEAKSIGIDVLQIDGWDIGGIDRNYPNYTIDPRLGTADELRAAIDGCKKIEVDILLFCNLQWANIETEEWREELHKYAVRDAFGNVRNSMGWEYNTTLGLLGQCEPRMVMMNPSHDEFRQLIIDRLLEIVRLGANGIQIDKLGTVAEVDYAAPYGSCPASSVGEGVLRSLTELVRRGRTINNDLAVAGETHWDRSLSFTEASYARYFNDDHIPTVSYTFPEFRQTVCITGDQDFVLVNNAVRFGHIINVEGAYLHGTVSAFPTLAPYIRDVLTMRRTLRSVLWDSRLCEPHGYSITATDSTADILFSVHESMDTTQRAVVIHHTTDHTVSVHLSIPGATEFECWMPGAPARRILATDLLDVPQHQVAVLVW